MINNNWIEAIRNDRDHGASELACKALRVMKDAAVNCKVATTEELMKDIIAWGDVLADCRPTMPIISTYIKCLQKQLHELACREYNFEELRGSFIREIDRLMAANTSAKIKAAKNAASYIDTGMRIATCSYSSTIVETICQAVQKEKTPEMLVLESRCGELCYGEVMLNRLTGSGVRVRIISDNITVKQLGNVDMILLGADAILPNGSVINGYPSLALCTAAADRCPHLPVNVVCENGKIVKSKFMVHLEPGFDLVPSELVNVIITDNGEMIGPDRLDGTG